MRQKIAIIILLFAPLVVSAHGDGGTLEKTEGDYFIDIGVSEPIVRAQTAVRFDFGIYKGPNKEEVDYNMIWIRWTKGNELIHVSTIARSSLSSPAVTFTFPVEGVYHLNAVFQKDSQNVSSADFDLAVSPRFAENENVVSNMSPFVIFVIGLGAGIVVQLVVNYFSGKFSKKVK